jgi:serine/threonine protein phosphatase 1
VLDFLIEAQARDERIASLAGNHEVSFLNFLAEPSRSGLFANNGGYETALSYGVTLDFEDRAAFRIQSEALQQAVPQAHRSFIEGLKLSVAIGDFFFCHAGIRPGVPLEEQSSQDLIWIRDTFLNSEDLHPKLIVHGHTPAPTPEVRPNRINLDTGAYGSGVLSALVAEGDDKQILQVAL